MLKCNRRKTWRLINELQSRQCKSTKVPQIKLGQQVFTSSEDISETFNNLFTSIGQTLVREIPTVDIDPLYYVKPSDRVFSFEMGSMSKKSSPWVDVTNFFACMFTKT